MNRRKWFWPSLFEVDKNEDKKNNCKYVDYCFKVYLVGLSFS